MSKKHHKHEHHHGGCCGGHGHHHHEHAHHHHEQDDHGCCGSRTSQECEDEVCDETHKEGCCSENSCDSEADMLQQIQDRLEQANSKYLHLLAENENSRKRFIKERQHQEKMLIQKVILDFLTPLDQFSRAMGFTQHMSPDVRNWAMGFEMILQQFKDVLTDYNIKSFSTKGSMFDPHLHEALEMIATQDFLPGTIIEECSPGYKMGDHVIRPAKVKVAQAISQEEVKEEN